VGALTALALGYSVVGVAGGIVVATALLAAVARALSARVTGIVPSLRGSPWGGGAVLQTTRRRSR